MFICNSKYFVDIYFISKFERVNNANSKLQNDRDLKLLFLKMRIRIDKLIMINNVCNGLLKMVLCMV